MILDNPWFYWGAIALVWLVILVVWAYRRPVIRLDIQYSFPPGQVSGGPQLIRPEYCQLIITNVSRYPVKLINIGVKIGRNVKLLKYIPETVMWLQDSAVGLKKAGLLDDWRYTAERVLGRIMPGSQLSIKIKSELLTNRDNTIFVSDERGSEWSLSRAKVKKFMKKFPEPKPF